MQEQKSGRAATPSNVPGPFAVMLFIALWNNQGDTYTNSAHVVGA